MTIFVPMYCCSKTMIHWTRNAILEHIFNKEIKFLQQWYNSYKQSFVQTISKETCEDTFGSTFA